MKILVTGAAGFVGVNLCRQLENCGYGDLLLYDIDTDPALLDEYTGQCDFVFHLAGVNRPPSEAEFMEGNFGFTGRLLDSLEKNRNRAPVVVSSSIQAALDNPYGVSKKQGEDAVRQWSARTGNKCYIYRLPNIFGKWCRPNYNSAVATFCHNIAHGLPVTVNDPGVVLTLVYIDDVVTEFIAAMKGDANRTDDFCRVDPTYEVELSRIVELLYSFREGRENLRLPLLSDGFTKKLYSTFLSYLPRDGFSYPLKMNRDERGSFTEFIKTPDRGQVSVNISRPHITKGDHWHNTKCEKFLVVSGRGVVRFRRPGDDNVTEYYVSGEELRVVDIPPGYSHNIENLGDSDMVTIMWVNEVFDPQSPDTYYCQV